MATKINTDKSALELSTKSVIGIGIGAIVYLILVVAATSIGIECYNNSLANSSTANSPNNKNFIVLMLVFTLGLGAITTVYTVFNILKSVGYYKQPVSYVTYPAPTEPQTTATYPAPATEAYY
jgi:hypothetical protein